MVLGVSKHGVKVASVDQCVSSTAATTGTFNIAVGINPTSPPLRKGRAASTPSLLDRAHAVLRRRAGSREEPAGSENHRHKARALQHLGVPVQQLGRRRPVSAS